MRSGEQLQQRFWENPLEVFLGVLEAHAAPMTVAEIRGELVKAGLDEKLVKSKWSSAQKQIKSKGLAKHDGSRYEWTGEQPVPSKSSARPDLDGDIESTDALRLLVHGPRGQKVADREALAAIVLTALKTSTTRKPRDSSRVGAIEEAERHKHLAAKLKAENVRILAELAMDLEELIGNGASNSALIERIRTRAEGQGLTAIGDAGAAIPFDSHMHDSVAGSPKLGTSVVVIRPGYLWRATKEEVLVAKALVIEQ